MNLLESIQHICYNGITDDTYRIVLQEIIDSFGFEDLELDEQRGLVLLHYLDGKVSPDDLYIDGDTISVGGDEYLVLTDEEASDQCYDRISDSLWSFKTHFLSSETGFDETIFEALKPQCEDANDAIKSLVNGSCGLYDLVQSAISCDGRGHFLATYDGDEIEVSNGFFLYRI